MNPMDRNWIWLCFMALFSQGVGHEIAPWVLLTLAFLTYILAVFAGLHEKRKETGNDIPE